jgi:hypothetical protein
VGLSDLGDAVTWGEVRILLQEAAGDPSTALGAELAGWSYPATVPALLTLSAQLGKQSRDVMPWVLVLRGDQATPEEVATALAEIDSGLVFT